MKASKFLLCLVLIQGNVFMTLPLFVVQSMYLVDHNGIKKECCRSQIRDYGPLLFYLNSVRLRYADGRGEDQIFSERTVHAHVKSECDRQKLWRSKLVSQVDGRCIVVQHDPHRQAYFVRRSW